MSPYLVLVSPADLPPLLDADASLYPSPLTLSTLSSWTSTAPSLSFKYLPTTESTSPCGVCIILPLFSMHWEALIRGELKEWDITPAHLGIEDEAVGLHVWHIERFEAWQRDWGSFGSWAWKDLEKAVERMVVGGSKGVIGYSALCVTPAGEHLFRELLGFTDSRYYSGQVVVKDAGSGRTEIVEREVWERTPSEQKKGEIVAQCRMLVRYS
ncbi:uncharacterized protein H6S33_005612 [Morchella sextelata]|uniref:uncharacterized protein n=1 Tax=Morchella sextelata TaxID=1174677 RepID=UPI001D044B2F|nr:uncharacterized protein H6S33_005612 [Morchella sextelata]KAH0613726.1 hypothetical protein H6S33_005612 [Morchella sextelata]